MKKFFILIFIYIVCLGFLGSNRTHVLFPIFDHLGDFPCHMRSVNQSPIKNSTLNLQGLQNLKASGSGQFSEKNFYEIVRHLRISPQQLIVIDLRQESHGFINGNPITWTDGNDNYGNLHKKTSAIETDEDQLLRLACHAKQVIVNSVENPAKITVQRVNTERAFVETSGSTYIRLPVTDHHRPSDQVTDQFVDLVRNLPGDRWLHFHCKAGKGRTTTFLTLLDMMKNAKQVSLSDILARQQLLGGSNLNEIPKMVGEKKRAAIERLEFVQRFYQYCRQVRDFQISWSTWIEQQNRCD
jgi:Inositol hexakisphosphate